jgi:hypothetical protein
LTVGHYTPTDWSGETLNKVTFEDLRIETTLEQGFGWPIVQTFDVLTLDRLNTNKAALVFGQGTASNMGTGGQIVVRDVVASNLHDVDGANNNLPLAQIWTPSDATATRSWLNKRISNKGASGTVTVTLPAGTKGDRFLFHRTASHAFRIDPNGSEVIRGGGPGKYLSLDAVGAYVELRWIRNTWEPVAVVGTASFEP